MRALSFHHVLQSPLADWAPGALILAIVLLLAASLTLLPLTYAAALVVGSATLVLITVRPTWGLFPLIFSIPWSVREVSLGPLTVGATEGLVGLVLAGWLAQMVARRRVQTVHPPLLVPLLVFLGAILVSLLSSLSLPLSLKEVVKWMEVLGVYLFMANTVDEELGRVLVAAILLAGISQALLGLYQFFWQVGPPGFLVGGRFIRAYGTFQQPNPYAGYLGLILPLALAVFLSRPRALSLWVLSGAALALMGIAVGISLSRGAWLGFAASTIVVIALGIRWGGLNPVLVAVLAGVAFASLELGLFLSSLDSGLALGWQLALALTVATLGAVAAGSTVHVALRRGWSVAIAGMLLLTITLFLLTGGHQLLPPVLAQRLAGLGAYMSIPDVRGAEITSENFALLQRLAHWQAAWGMITDHPWLGVGIGNFAVAYPAYALPRWEEPLGHAHNYYLNVTAEAGLIGLGAYLALFAACFWSGWRALGRSVTPDPVADLPRAAVILGGLGVLTALSVHNIFDNLYVHGMYVHIAMILGLIHVSGPEGGRESFAV